MKRPALVLSLLAAGAALHAAPDTAALQKAWGKHSSHFHGPTVGGAGQLRVTATEVFLEARPADKHKALEELAASWRAAGAADPLLIEVRWRYGGWLWRGKNGGKGGRETVALVDRWDDGSFPWVQNSAFGKWFLFLGGQSVSGGGLGSSSGFSLRIGSTLFRDKYDVAFTFNRTSTANKPNPDIELTALGVLGRALFRVPGKNWGYNLGGSVTRISGENFDTENELSLLAGLNYYQRAGTWDLSLNLGDEGSRTLVLGYSIFLTR
jgi:hypothetical protein